MKSIRYQLTKASESLFSRYKSKNMESFHLIKSNKSETTAFLQYATAATALTLFKTYKKLKNLIEGKKPVIKEYPKDTVIIFQFGRSYDIPSVSQFALRLETWCRAAGIKYQNEFTTKMSSQGLIPYIKLNDYLVEDSGKCIEYLSKIYNINFDSDLTVEQKATARAILKLTETSLSWSMALHRFWYNKNGAKDLHIPRMNYWYFSHRVFRRAYAAGYGRLPKEDVYESGKRDLSALNVLMGEKKFLYSDTKPCDTDFMVFALIAQIKYTDRGPLNLHLISECKNLNRHVETMKALYWPDWNQNTLASKLTVSKKKK